MRCNGNTFFVAEVCFSRTISLPSFNALCYKLAKIARFFIIIRYWIECVMSSIISFAYFEDFFLIQT